MIKDNTFTPLHISATTNDFLGNGGHGRYLMLPGSDSRARKISEMFDSSPTIRHSSRGHNLYLGTITRNNITIDVGAISTGMGTPSADIILNELIKLGASKLLRVGTCGLLQPKFMKAGDLAIATASVRDENATTRYVPIEYPAVASHLMISSNIKAAKKIMENNFHVGVFHTKDSLYAREFKQGPMQIENSRYMQIIKDSGAIASEMESSIFFVLTNYYKNLLQKNIISGALCTVLGEDDDFGTPEQINKAIEKMLEVAVESYFNLHQQLQNDLS